MLPGVRSRYRRLSAVGRAVERRVARRWVVRMGRMTAWYVSVSHGALVVWAGRAAPEADTASLVLRAATFVTVAAGLVALGAAVDVRPMLRADALEPLLRQRGISAGERSSAVVLATVTLVTRATLWPMLAVSVAAVAMSQTISVAMGRLALAAGLSLYAVVAGLLLGVVARWSVAIGTSRPRLLFAAIVVVPYVVGAMDGRGLSVIHLLGGLLDRVAGGAVG